MHENTALTGGCICGDVRYVVTGAPRFVCVCHCHSCRTASGGAMVPWATFGDTQWRIERGQLTASETSVGVTREHCARCGTSITYRHAQRPGELDITVASLDDANAVRPTVHIWTQDKLAWLVIADDLPQYPRSSSG